MLELRDAGDGTLTFEGIASRTEAPYEVGYYVEVIRRGAFKRTLGNPNLDVQLLVNHEGLPLARTTTGDLRLSETSEGLKMVASLDADDPEVQALARKVRRGVVDEMSMAFRAVQQAWNEDYTERQVLQAELMRGDVSIVSYGASPSTTVSIRSQRSQLTLEQRRKRAERIGERVGGQPRGADDGIPSPSSTADRARSYVSPEELRATLARSAARTAKLRRELRRMEGR
jgi:HK97 family phage prohead protease